MTKMVNFRNLFTDLYVTIDMEQIYFYLQNDIPLFEHFRRMIIKGIHKTYLSAGVTLKERF